MIKSYRSKRRKIQEEINLYESNLFNNNKSTNGFINNNNNIIDSQPSCSWQSVPLISETQNDESTGLSFNDKLVLGRYIFLLSRII